MNVALAIIGPADGAGTHQIPSMRKLSALRKGECGIVCSITAEPRLAKRLADMGFVGGSRVDMVRPGRPCLVRVNGTRVGLGRGSQEHVLVDSPHAE